MGDVEKRLVVFSIDEDGVLAPLRVLSRRSAEGGGDELRLVDDMGSDDVVDSLRCGWHAFGDYTVERLVVVREMDWLTLQHLAGDHEEVKEEQAPAGGLEVEVRFKMGDRPGEHGLVRSGAVCNARMDHVPAVGSFFEVWPALREQFLVSAFDWVRKGDAQLPSEEVTRQVEMFATEDWYVATVTWTGPRSVALMLEVS